MIAACDWCHDTGLFGSYSDGDRIDVPCPNRACRLSPDFSPTHLRGTHPYTFRSGQWAEILTTVESRGRDCWFVRFPDGVTDWMPKEDPSEPYEFKWEAHSAICTCQNCRRARRDDAACADRSAQYKPSRHRAILHQKVLGTTFGIYRYGRGMKEGVVFRVGPLGHLALERYYHPGAYGRRPIYAGAISVYGVRGRRRKRKLAVNLTW